MEEAKNKAHYYSYYWFGLFKKIQIIVGQSTTLSIRALAVIDLWKEINYYDLNMHITVRTKVMFIERIFNE